MKLSRTKTVIYSLIPVTVVFAALEGSARIWEHWHPPFPADYGWGFDAESRLYIPSDDYPGWMITNPSKRISFCQEEFQMPKPPDVFRVFVVGGSTILNAENQLWYMSIKLTLQLKRPCQVIDAGGGGYGTHRLVAVISEIMAYQPDVVVLSTGNNEFVEVEQLELAQLKMLPLQKVLYKSAFCRTIRDRIAVFELDRRRREKNQRLLRSIPSFRSPGDDPPFATQQKVDQRMNDFREYLTAIVKICQAHRVPLIFGTTPSNLVWLFKDKPPETLPVEVRRAKDLYASGQYQECLAIVRDWLRRWDRGQASDAENEIIRDVASKNSIPIADTEEAVIAAEPHHVPGETLFINDCHFTEDGTKIMCDVFMNSILNLVGNR